VSNNATIDAMFNTMDSALCKAFNDADDLADIIDNGERFVKTYVS